MINVILVYDFSIPIQTFKNHLGYMFLDCYEALEHCEAHEVCEQIASDHLDPMKLQQTLNKVEFIQPQPDLQHQLDETFDLCENIQFQL